MVAAELISPVISPLRPQHTVAQALQRLADFRQAALPLVMDKACLGLVTEDELVEQRDTRLTLAEVDMPLQQVSVTEGTHIYDCLAAFSQTGSHVLPVLSGQGEYIGTITTDNLVGHLAQLFAAGTPGAVLVLEISTRNNSLAHLSALIEAEGAQILSSYVNAFDDSTRLEVTLKLNRAEVEGIINALGRHGYAVSHKFNTLDKSDLSEERYSNFMHYLDI